MPLETGTYISDLNASNPPASDGISQGDDHLRLLKATIKATFPNINGAVNATPTQLNNLLTVLSTFVNAGLTRLQGNGSVAVGSIHAFPKVPSSFQTGGGAGTGAQYIECDGQIYNVADYPDLGAYLGSTYGGNGTTTFGVPTLKDTGRFLRSRTASVAVGTLQTNQNAAHTHTFSGTTSTESNDHIHTWGGTFTTSGASNTHTHSIPAFAAIGGVSGGGGAVAASGSTTTSVNDLDHSHTVTVGGNTGGINVNHTHTYSGTTSSSGSTEARPEAFVVVYAIKT